MYGRRTNSEKNARAHTNENKKERADRKVEQRLLLLLPLLLLIVEVWLEVLGSDGGGGCGGGGWRVRRTSQRRTRSKRRNGSRSVAAKSEREGETLTWQTKANLLNYEGVVSKKKNDSRVDGSVNPKMEEEQVRQNDFIQHTDWKNGQIETEKYD